jgi:hypothetical protein
MSDNWLRFVPTDPYRQPASNTAKAASDLLATFVPRAQQIQAQFLEKVVFFDPGGNLESIRCPVCSADLQEWWGDAMDGAIKEEFERLRTTTPCCGGEASLNDLRYNWPAAFGSFVLEVMNPKIRDTAPDQEKALSDCVGHDLRKIWVHI